jgi:hypothetical protein
LKQWLSILSWLLPCFAPGQNKDSARNGSASIMQSANPGVIIAQNNYKPEIFTSGFIDIVNNGQVNASARFLRLYIGEPGKFSVPISLYTGVSSNNFQNTSSLTTRSNDGLVTNFINPLSGLANISVDGVWLFRKPFKVTNVGLLYHVGERILTGYRTGLVTDPRTGKPVNFLNSYGTLGLYFQTGAWDRNNSKNVGISWLALRYIGTISNDKQLNDIFPKIQTNGIYHGYSIAWGIEINNLVNIKAVYYKYIKKPEIDYYLPIYQFSFNYSFKK